MRRSPFCWSRRLPHRRPLRRVQGVWLEFPARAALRIRPARPIHPRRTHLNVTTKRNPQAVDNSLDIDGIRHGARALILKPLLKPERSSRHPEAMLAEAVGLAEAIALEVVTAAVQPINHPVPATLFGSGQVEHWGHVVRDAEIVLAVVDHALSPVQQRNLERAWQCKVIDRTSLILEIFGERARTKEGQLQVELAALNYQKSRLVRS